MDQKTQVILLAAGYGSRISDVTSLPKCLLIVHGETLLERNLRIWHSLGIRDIHLVLGYKKEEILKVIDSDRVKKNFPDFCFTFTCNEDFRTKGNTYSLYLGLEYFHRVGVAPRTLIFDADLIYHEDILKDFLSDGPFHEDQILVGPADISDIECAKVLLDKNGFVFATIDKRAIHEEELKENSFVGEAIGILKFSNKSLPAFYQEALSFLSHPENILKNWEHLINIFAPKAEIKVSYLRPGLPWVEIDNQEDYNAAKDLFRI